MVSLDQGDVSRPIKYNLEPLPSLAGVASESANPGDIVNIITRMEMFSKEQDSTQEKPKQTLDDFHLMVRHQIHSLLSEWVFPRILKMFSTNTVPKDFFLMGVYAEMYSDETKNKLLINEDTGFKVLYRLEKGVVRKPGAVVTLGDVKEVVGIEKEDKDPNAATIMLVIAKDGWFGSFDYTYNRGYAQEKIDRAINFFSAAKENLDSSNIQAFYESLWSCSELLAESLLLLHRRIEFGENVHKVILERFEGFCKQYNYGYIDDYKLIAEVRKPARYGSPHKWDEKWELEAPRLLQSTREFLGSVLNSLKEIDVVPSNQDYGEYIL